MRIAFVLALLLMLQSCGLFKNTTRDMSHEQRELQATAVSVTKGAKSIIEDSAINISESRLRQADRDWRVYPRPGTTTTIHPDGSISGDIDSVVERTLELTNEVRDVAATAKRQLDSLTSDSTFSEFVIIEDTEKKKTRSTPDWKLYVFISLACVLIWIIFKFVK